MALMSLGTAVLIATGVGFIATGAAATKDKPTLSSAPKNRRTSSDYAGTSFKLRPTYGTRPVQAIQPIKAIQPIQPINNIQAIQPLQVIQPINPWQYRPGSTFNEDPLYNKYTDPYNVNSLADVVMNRKGGDLVLEELNLDVLKYIPVAREIVLGINHLWEQYVDPVTTGIGYMFDNNPNTKASSKFTEAGINALIDFGETADILANPIKGLILDGPKGFIAGSGLGDYGRVQYDYNVDTGNGVTDFIVNMGAEIFSDPLNLISFGTTGALKSSAKGIVKEAAPELAEKTAKKYANQIASEYLKKGYISDTLKKDLAITLSKNTNKTYNMIIEQLDLINSSRILKSVQTLNKGADVLDRAIFRATPFGYGLGTAGKAVFGSQSNSLVNMVRNKYIRSFNKAYQANPFELNNKVVQEKIAAVDNLISDTTMKVQDIPGGFENLLQRYYKYVDLKGIDNVNKQDFLQYLLDSNIINKAQYDTYIPDASVFDEVYEALELKAGQIMALNSASYSFDFFQNKLNDIARNAKSKKEIIDNIENFLRNVPENQRMSDFSLYNFKKLLDDKFKSLQKLVDDLKQSNSSAYINASIELDKTEALSSLLNNFLKEHGITTQMLHYNTSAEHHYILRILEDIRDPEARQAMLRYIIDYQTKRNKGMKEYAEGRIQELIDELDNLQKALQQDYETQYAIAPAHAKKTIAKSDKIKIELVDDSDSIKPEIIKDARKPIGGPITETKVIETEKDALGRVRLENARYYFPLIEVIEYIKDGSNPGFVKNKLDALYDLKSNITDVLRHIYDDIEDQRATLRTVKQNEIDITALKKYYTNTRKKVTIKPKAEKTISDLLQIEDRTDLVRQVAYKDDIDAILKDDAIKSESKIKANEIIDDLKARVKEIKEQAIRNIKVRKTDVTDLVQNSMRTKQTNYKALLKQYNDINILRSNENKITDDALKVFEKAEQYTNNVIGAMRQGLYNPNSRVLYKTDSLKDADLIALEKYYMLNYTDVVQESLDNVENDIAHNLGKEFIQEDIVDLDEAPIIDRLNLESLTSNPLRTYKDITDAITDLQRMGYMQDFDINKVHDTLLNTLFEGETMFWAHKTPQLAIHTNILKEYDNNPELKKILYAIANDNEEEAITRILNMVIDMATKGETLTTLSSDAAAFKIVAKAHVLYENFMKDILDINSKYGAGFLDYISGYGYNNIREFMSRVYKDGVIDKDKIEQAIYDRIYSGTHLNSRTNSSLATRFGFKVDENKIHNAQYDIDLTRFNHEQLIREGAARVPKDGEVFVHFDIETTGVDPRNAGADQILQIGATRSKWDAATKTFKKLKKFTEYSYLKKGYNINEDLINEGVFDSDFINKVTNIDPNATDVFSEEQLIQNFYDFINNGDKVTLVGHNSHAFDLPQLEARARGAVDFSRFAEEDTLRYANKYFGAPEDYIPSNIIDQYADLLDAYLTEIKNLKAERVVNLIDSNVLDRMFNVARDLLEITKDANPRTALQRMNKSVFKDALERFIGTTKYTTDVEFGPKEWTDAVKAGEYSDAESFIKGVRSLLGEVKKENQRLGEYILTRSKLDQLAKDFVKVGDDVTPAQLDVFALYNGTRIQFTEDGTIILPSLDYKPSNVTTKKYVVGEKGVLAPADVFKESRDRYIFKRADYNEKLRLRIEEANIQKETKEEIIHAMDTLDDINTDLAAKEEAAEYLGSLDLNYTQASRLKSSYELQNFDVIPKGDIPERVQALTDSIRLDSDSYIDIAGKYASELEQLSEEAYAEVNNRIAINDTIRKLRLNTEDLLTYIMHTSAEHMIIGDAFNPQYVDLVNRIIDNAKEFEQYGFKVVVDGNKIGIMPIAGMEQTRQAFKQSHNTPIKLDDIVITSSKYNDKYNDQIINILNKSNEILDEFNKIETPFYKEEASTSAHNILYADTFHRIREKNYNLFKGTPLMEDGKGTITSNFFKPNRRTGLIADQREIRYTDTYIGSVKGRRSIDSYYQNPLNKNVGLMQHTIKRANAASKYTHLYFNKRNSINGIMYKDLTDEQLLNAYKDNSSDYTMLIVTADDKKGLPIVRSFKPNTLDDLKFARKMDAIIVPIHESNQIKNIINRDTYEKLFSKSKVQLLSRMALTMMKVFYLSNPGTIIRNFLDVIVKNSVDENYGLEQAPRAVMEFARAASDWKKYEGMVDTIIKEYNSFDKDSINFYFENLVKERGEDYAKEMQDLFEEIHTYAQSNASAGMAEAQKQLILDYYRLNDPSLAERFLNWNPFMRINSYVEHAGRLSSYRMSIEEGLNASEALTRTLKRHFDYGVRNRAQAIFEYVIPFSTFPMYNLQYWADNITESPWLIEALVDASRMSLDIEEQNQFMLDNSEAVQNRMYNGQIKIGNTVFKINPSFYDAFNIANIPEQLDTRVMSIWKSLYKGVTGLKEQESVSEYSTNLDKIGLGEFEKTANDLGFYPLTRVANTILKGVGTLLGPESGLETIDHPADVMPSFLSDGRQKYGTKLGETFDTIILSTPQNNIYNTMQSQTGRLTKSTMCPKVSYTAGRSYNRIPYVRWYYGGSYNFYNSWKAQRASRYPAQVPPSPESLQYAFKGLLYDLGMDPLFIKMYNLKQGMLYKTWR